MSSPSVTFSSQSWNHDVFLSFRGEDTRKTFVDHLYSALVRKGIYTYKDDETLARGESISPSLMKAIEESQIAVIVFSKNYANSSWCMEEVAYIMKCKEARGQIVMPIFYDVDPSVVRKQNQNFGEAFSRHELESCEKVESWRKALVDASNVSGWEIKHIANGHESKGIEEIVNTILQRLHLVTSGANKNLIGIEARVQDLKSKLQIGSGGVRMIGIWGVGGSGKTTLAYSIYEETFTKFDGCCFVENIREESSRYGLEKLQDKILSNVLKQNEMEVIRVGGGRCLINKRFHQRKVLIVLDDVNHLDQLKALAGTHDWFGDGSRIIITTRDEHLLTAHRVDVIHTISLLNEDEAIKLFCKHASPGYIPTEDYELLSKCVVSYAGGLPLALTVLGSFLCDKDVNEWRSALARLKEIPNIDIVEKLKISFDGLTKDEQKLFLDIACFFRWEDKDRAMEMLDACGFHPVIGVKVLIQKALITISNGKFDMHDLVQEMGHYIVRGEHPTNPEKHSRVWRRKDVLKICAMDATTELDMIEAIKFEYDRNNKLCLRPFVANMKNLRLIVWGADLMSPFPTNFPPTGLCCLRLYGVLQKQIWGGYKFLPNLRNMELCGLDNLITTPDFDGLPNLERFKLVGSSYLEEIHPSIGFLESLVLLSIECCLGLKMLPPITRLKKLKTLRLSWCPKLFKVSEIQQNKKVASYKKSCTKFFVTCWTCGCSNLRGDANVIDVECCSQEPCLPHNNINHIGLQFSHRSLRELDLSYCSLEDEDIGSHVWELPNLEILNLSGNDFSQINFNLLQLPRLKWLNMSYCECLVQLLEVPSSISILKADYCTSLETIRDISNCKWLWKVSLRGENNISPLDGDIFLCSILQGNATEDHFINVTLEHQIAKHFIASHFWYKKSTLPLPHDWYNDYCGFLIRIVSDMKYPNIYITVKKGVQQTIGYIESKIFHMHDNFRVNLTKTLLGPKFDGTTSDLGYESDDERTTSLGYVSFSSLRHTSLLNSSFNMISFSLGDKYWGLDDRADFGVMLVPRKRKVDQMQTKNCSEFWGKEGEDGNPFRIQHDSKSSLRILWHPYNWF